MKLTNLSEKQKLITEIASYMITYDASIREASKVFDIPKTTVHRWIYKELRFINDDLFVQIKNRLKSRRK